MQITKTRFFCDMNEMMTYQKTLLENGWSVQVKPNGNGYLIQLKHRDFDLSTPVSLVKGFIRSLEASGINAEYLPLKNDLNKTCGYRVQILD